MRTYLLILVLAAALTYLLVPLVLRIALATGAITQIRERDVHSTPIARLGGVAMFAGLVGALALASQIPYLREVFAPSTGVWAILWGGAIMCVLGAIDDVWELTWYSKFAGEILAAGVMAWQGVQLVTVPLLGLTVGSTRLTLFATIIAVVVVANAVNFVDGLDGLAAGVVGIAAFAFFIYAYYLTREVSPGDYTSVATTVLAALVGSCVGFLPHNFHPARIFMGDSGALMLGTVLAGATILVTGQIDPATVGARQALPAFMPLVIPLLVLLIPLIDLTWAVFRRVRQGRSPFSADAGHLHHRLLRRGHSHTVAVLILYMWTAIASFSAVAYTVYPGPRVLAGAALTIFAGTAVTWQKFGKRRAA
ncbi:MULTISPECIES: MraY family glycosyltransferase [Trueperella]|uniref:Decaprenyl-phosphate N-acetylglucosaminephosphotransferase n=1 Tax=Trueperella bernardiae TaxID=59561 RepID=A0A0W1KJZ8_9ACTO|nr:MULTISPECIES: MraY family glycosyltransferase [Trueperella]KTF04360.1 Decaprenyl-phosphate N-acetylglucosaminephosphotransferase [Trueperella bernardiae]MCM3906802.1 undecaprenyl/decaprenyl-phosphate alpha-N-acetylglucosaminyl 1-phosphate transferase [Trueperella bernardiae]MDK8601371.1 MraY family glycosyltransferase [Trueperella bernardiae]OCW60773.1 UDP-N-acetylmuramyl pentapeptide phosphotransferase [Trueperella bernardiae]PKZ89603.1 undecaprenyl/decaprenyl-phosphate alpha-N-acetylgluco